jgi:prophage regulatory protein
MDSHVLQLYSAFGCANNEACQRPSSSAVNVPSNALRFFAGRSRPCEHTARRCEILDALESSGCAAMAPIPSGNINRATRNWTACWEVREAGVQRMRCKSSLDHYEPNMNRSHLNLPIGAADQSFGGQAKSENEKVISSEADEVIFLRLPKVKAVTGLSKSSLYELIRANSFPAPVHLGARTVAWVASEVKQWAAERILSSRTPGPNVASKRTPQRALPGQWASKKWA